MRLRVALLALGAIAAAGLPCRADSSGLNPTGETVEVKDFRFEDGQSLADLKLHYLTLGTPRRNADGDIDNAVLLLHGTTGTAQTFITPRFAQSLFGKDEPLDLDRFYIVIPDGIGAGGSSKPSDGLHAHFPRYGYLDQIRAQRILLSDIGVTHLALVIGTSMGGMQTWLWAETYPEAADAFVPIASTPAQISGRNEVWREMIIQAIRDDPDWKNGEYPKDHPPRDWIRAAMPLFSIMTSTAEVMQREAPTRAAAIGLVDAVEDKAKARDANDFLYTFDSSYDYDPAPRLSAIVRPVFSINFADDLLNPPELLALPNAPNVTEAMIPAKGGYGHESLAHPELWAPSLQAFLTKLASSKAAAPK